MPSVFLWFYILLLVTYAVFTFFVVYHLATYSINRAVATFSIILFLIGTALLVFANVTMFFSIPANVWGAPNLHTPNSSSFPALR